MTTPCTHTDDKGIITVEPIGKYALRCTKCGRKYELKIAPEDLEHAANTILRTIEEVKSLQECCDSIDETIDLCSAIDSISLLERILIRYCLWRDYRRMKRENRRYEGGLMGR